jgi:hypothetical protein
MKYSTRAIPDCAVAMSLQAVELDRLAIRWSTSSSRLLDSCPGTCAVPGPGQGLLESLARVRLRHARGAFKTSGWTLSQFIARSEHDRYSVCGADRGNREAELTVGGFDSRWSPSSSRLQFESTWTRLSGRPWQHMPMENSCWSLIDDLRIDEAGMVAVAHGPLSPAGRTAERASSAPVAQTWIFSAIASASSIPTPR